MFYEAMQFGKSANNEIKDDKMETILEDPKLPLDHKVKLYNQELQKVIYHRDHIKQETTNEDEMDTSTHHKDIIEAKLIGSLPLSLKVKESCCCRDLKQIM